MTDAGFRSMDSRPQPAYSVRNVLPQATAVVSDPDDRQRGIAMDLVLGLSVSSTAVRWVPVEGWSGDGDAVDRGTLDVTDVDTFDADALLTVLLDANESVVESGLHAIG